MNELTKVNTEKNMIVHSFRLLENGVEAIGNPSFENWLSCLQFVKSAGRSVHFWLGDLLVYGEFHYGETYRRAVEETGFDIQTLRNDKWVASRIPPERRQDTLSFDHHQQVADLDAEEQEELLSAAVAKHMTTRDFRSFVNQQQMKDVKPKQHTPSSLASSFIDVMQTLDVLKEKVTLLSKRELSYDEYESFSAKLDEVGEVIATVQHAEFDNQD